MVATAALKGTERRQSYTVLALNVTLPNSNRVSLLFFAFQDKTTNYHSCCELFTHMGFEKQEEKRVKMSPRRLGNNKKVTTEKT